MKKTIIKTWLFIFLSSTSFFAQASDTLKTAIKVGVVKEYCLDTSSFAGMMTSLTDLCSGANGTAVNFVLQDNYCIGYGGLSLGTEATCLAYCDDTGQCDTTVLIVTVVPDSVSTLPAIAVDDFLETTENTPVSTNILSNDLLPNNGAFTSLRLIQSAGHGSAVIDDIGELTYSPGQDFCGDTDTLLYEVCNIVSCDTGYIYVTVAECLQVDGIFVYDGFSPNGDYINDFWKIHGLDEFPNHHIYVYNRWGNIVFETKNYENNWDGKWDATPLPPGTYFYLIDTGTGKKQTGYVQIGY